MKLVSALAVIAVLLAGCDDGPPAGASASASAPPRAAPTPTPTPSQTASEAPSASAPVLPGTVLKDVLKNVDAVMAMGKASGPMGVMIADKKDVAALVAALGTDQALKKAFESKCATPTMLDFQSKDHKSLGVLAFCEGDFAKGRFDGSGATSAEIAIKDQPGFQAVLKKVGAIK